MSRPMAKSKPTKKSNPAPAKAAAVAKPKSVPTTDKFLQEIKDLGGDEDDWKMLQGIDGDDVHEVEGTEVFTGETQVDEVKLSKELSSFMNGLDFSSFQNNTHDSEEEADQAGSSEEDALDDSESEGEMPMDTPNMTKKEKKGAAAEAAAAAAAAVEEKPKEVPVKKESKLVLPSVSVSTPSVIPKGSKGQFVFPPIPQWYLHDLPALPETDSLPPLSAPLLSTLTTRSLSLLESLPTSQPSPAMSSKADSSFLSQILKSGTQADKLSALILLVQGDPLRNVTALEGLRAMLGYKKEDGTIGRMGGREERVSVLRAVADWWTGGGSPPRKLRYLRDQPMLTHPQVTDAHLIVWAFEDWLKRFFFTLLQVLETMTHDTLPFVRTQTIRIVFQLLKDSPEQEQNLLRLLVNKLGDSDRNVASRASYHILQLLQSHPAMKSVVVREIASLVLAPAPPKPLAPKRPQQTKKGKSKGKAQPMAKKTTLFDKTADEQGNLHARYYGITTLNQTTLLSRDGEVAGKLVEVYFEVFRGILGDGNGKDDPKLDELALGPAAEEAKEKESTDGKHKGKGNWKGKGKGKKPEAAEDAVVDSDAKMIAAVLTGVNRAMPFAKIDDNLFERHMDTLFRITHSGAFNISIQALNLIFSVSSKKESVSDRFYRTLYESLLDPRLITSSKQAMYLNLLFKAVKKDPNAPRAAAFVKRTIQILSSHQPPFICGAFFLFGELFSAQPGLRRMLTHPEDDDEEEHFVDAPNPDDEEEKEKKEVGVEETQKAAASKKWGTAYDGLKRQPEYANAQGSCLWEIVPFLHHFHPSVALHASQLLNGEPITGSSDLNLNTLVHFLDRFVYRNAKKAKPKGASIMQPAAASDKSGVVLMMKGPSAETEVNTAEFWRQKEEDVPADQLFFHKFFNQKISREKSKASKLAKRKKGGNDDDDEMSAGFGVEGSDAEEDEDLPRQAVVEEKEDGSDDESDDDVEAEIWKAMQKSMPAVEEDQHLMEDDSDSDEYSEAGSEDLDSDEAGALAEFNSDEDEDGDEDDEGQIDDAEFDSEDEEVFDLDEDPEDLLSEDDVPSAFPDEDDNEMSDDEAAPSTEVDGKRKRTSTEDRKERKKKRKLPLFGSYEDYQKLIDEGGPEDNV
ncbi:CAATT-binding transcription factor/60S ribosomal subunit biogenesis protein [Phaffia rhodozyma]|uniref:CAATT-binding transcription factor/60S ribosomal subunit biogenesis protein n=1 Tax=Phaffia rhodozyma TaxID=264483 RepID=A0A0F7SGL5_PHARH|nr:CAATT-binding transcription factor/60S ribosomal subunit biogenesis protein [Phaffia rhodozyma]